MFRVMLILSLCLAIAVCAAPVMAKENTHQAVDDTEIFLQRLSQCITDGKAVSKTSASDSPEIANAVKSANNLWNFADEFPNSKFANDSRSFLIILNFLGALDSKNINSVNKWLNKMEDLARLHPDDKMKDLTIQKLKDYWKDTPTECFMSNADLLIRLRADVSINSNNYEAAVKYYLLLKNRLDTIKEPSGLLEREVYSYLVFSYEELGKFKDELNIANEAIYRFPDNKKLEQAMRNAIDRISPRLINK